MVNIRPLKCILFGAVIGFFVSMYYINLVAVCCNTADVASHGRHCVICVTNEAKNITLRFSDPSILPTEKSRLSHTGYLKFFDEKTFQRIENACPSSICEDGPCVPTHLQVTMFLNRLLECSETQQIELT